MPRIANQRPSPGSILRHTLAVLLFLIAAGCSGGGCGSGCSSCGGITPLANGFDVNSRIENAGSARVTPSGLKFLQSNLATLAKGLLGGTSQNGVILFPVPQTSTSIVGLTVDVCKNGPNPSSNPKVCEAEIDIGNSKLTITPAGPYDLHVTGTIPLRAQDIQVSLACADINIALNGDGSCPGGNYASVPVNVDIAIHVDQNMNHTARYGYTQLTINSIVDEAALKSQLSNDLHICGVPSCDALCCITHLCSCALAGIADWSPVKNAILNTLVPQLDSTLKSSIEDQLCQKATPQEPCPTGTTADGSMVCRYNNDPNKACATTLLGLDGHIDLGGLLASLSPGTKGGLDFLFAAGGPSKNTNDPTMKLSWGDLDPVNGGASLGLFGGAEPNPLSKCVKMSDLPVPTGIPIPDELLGAADTLPDWPAGTPGPHVEIALNERFTNYALNGVYNSGLLCIGISTESIPLLSSGTLGLLAPSSKDLGIQEETQQVAIVIRPANPPTVVFGNGTDIMTDPLLRVGLKAVSLDFYMFSLDRFIRFMTATFDLDVPVNLTVDKNGLTPVIQQIGVSNGVVTNSQLLSEKPDQLAAALGSLIGSLVGQQLAGSLKAINLNSSLASLGLELIIPDTVMGKGSPGLRKLTKGSDNYLGIFAGLGLAGMGPVPPGPVPPVQHTSVQLRRKSVDPEGLKLRTLRPENAPVVELLAESTLDDGTRTMEYQYKVDQGFWHPFQSSRYFTLRDDWMRVQGRHVVYVRSRAVGDPKTLDDTPAQIEVVVDAEAPRVALAEAAEGLVRVDTRDVVTPDALVRYRLDDKPWSEWVRASRLGLVAVGDAHQITVEAQDGEGNVGTATQGLVRGRFDGTAASGCGCRTAGGDAPQGQAIFLLGMALAGIGARLFRRRRTALPLERGAGRTSAAPVEIAAPLRKAPGRLRRAMGGAAIVAFAGSWAGCSCGSHPSANTGSSTGDTGCPSCIDLAPGLIGEYSSAAVAGTDIWVAGYSEADWDNGNQYGDLVVGKFDGKKVNWTQVDGVPETPAPDCTVYNCKGFRGGQTQPGDDVGLWTSIAIGADNNPAVAYYDRTHHALKFAQYDGKSWTTQTVDSVMNGDVGRYAKLLFLNGGFVIAYQSIAPGGKGGALLSKVRVATSAGPKPAAGSWTFEDAAVSDTTPCRGSFCATTEACVTATKVCTATLDGSMCNPSCASGQACIDSGGPTCAAVWDSSKIDAYPDAIGDYISLAPDGQGGIGIAYYDRTNGNLMIAAKSGGNWATTLVDGEGAMGGDSGIGATLSIDTAGDWHLAYVNGYSEALQYVKVTKGTTVGKPEIVDDGLSVAGTAFDDGQHLVGDDAHLVVLASGEVHITYQDSTAGALHYAVGSPGSTGHLWSVNAPQQDGFAGAFSSIVVANNTTQLMNWWRVGGMSVKGDVRFLNPPQ